MGCSKRLHWQLYRWLRFLSRDSHLIRRPAQEGLAYRGKALRTPAAVPQVRQARCNLTLPIHRIPSFAEVFGTFWLFGRSIVRSGFARLRDWASPPSNAAIGMLISHVPEASVGVLSSVQQHLTRCAKWGIVQSITGCEQTRDVVTA